MSGMRPSGFCCRCERTKRSPMMRVPVTAPGSFAMTAFRKQVSTGADLAGLLSALGFCPLQVADLLLQRVDLRLLAGLLRSGGAGRSRAPGGPAALILSGG